MNRASFVVTNTGSLGFDFANQNAGLWYPRGSNLSLLFASGLWLGATVAGGNRLAIAEYSQEFAPGRIVAGIAEDPYDPTLRVWKVARWTGDPSDTAHVPGTTGHPSSDPIAHHSWSEYMAGAAAKGAPWKLYRLPATSTPAPFDSVDIPGPDVLGDQMTWCVFNDANPLWHGNAAGGTAPLSAEVQQTVFAFSDPGPMGDAIFIHWRVRNGGTLLWTGLRAGYWMDPDIGGASGFTDDKSGSDSTRSMAHAYNGDAVDGGYGTNPPALGAVLLTSAPPPPLGTTDGLGSFRSFRNGTDPQSALQSVNALSGLALDGSNLLHPLGYVTRFEYSGDPLLGSGWLDPLGSDKRMLASAAARDIVPGAFLDLWVAIVIAPEPGVANALAGLGCRANVVRSVFASGFSRPFPPTPACTPAASCPRPANYWQAQASGGGAYSTADMTTLASLIDQGSVALDFGSTPLAGLAAALSPGVDPRDQALREHAAFLANVNAARAGLHPTGDLPVTLSTLIQVNCPGIPAGETGELSSKAAETRAVSGDYRNLVLTNRSALEGINAGFSGFNGGAGPASGFLGSSLDPSVHPDSFPPLVSVLFHHTLTQNAHRYLRLERASNGGSPPQGRVYLYGGYVAVPFTVRDSATGEQLVAAFVERVLTDDAGTILPPALQPASFDSTWGPTAAGDGGREYLFVYRRPYSETPGPEFMVNGAVVGGALPGLYALWSRLRSTSDVIDDGDRFEFGFQYAFTPGTDAVLRDLAGQSLSDPGVLARYQQVADCLGAINRAESIGPTCESPTPALASLVSADAEPGRIRVEWYLASIEEVVVERRVDTGEWREFSATSPDGSGRVVIVDTEVQPGHRFSYRLRLPQGFAGEVSLEVPALHRLSLAGFQPNPTTGTLSVSCSLASSAPAHLEILDVTGRRVLAQPLDRPTPGQRQFALSGVRLAPGVYVLRLEQSGSRITARSVVLH